MLNPFARRETRAMNSALETLVACRDLKSIVDCLRLAALELAGADGITIIHREGDEVVYMTENAIAPLKVGHRFPVRHCVSGMAILANEAILVSDIRNDKRVPLNAYLSTFVHTMAMFPVGREKPAWAMGVYWREARTIDTEAIERLTALAALAGDVIAGIEGDPALMALDEPRRVA